MASRYTIQMQSGRGEMTNIWDGLLAARGPGRLWVLWERGAEERFVLSRQSPKVVRFIAVAFLEKSR